MSRLGRTYSMSPAETAVIAFPGFFPSAYVIVGFGYPVNIQRSCGKGQKMEIRVSVKRDFKIKLLSYSAIQQFQSTPCYSLPLSSAMICAIFSSLSA